MIHEKLKVEVKPSQIILKEDLNKIGTYKIDIKFHSEVSASISIKIDRKYVNEQLDKLVEDEDMRRWIL